MSKIRQFLKIDDGRYSTAEIFRWLWRSSRGNRTQAILNASVGILEVVVSLCSVWAVKRAIDKAQYHSDISDIYWAVAVMALFMVIGMLLRISMVWIKNLLGIKAQNRMQQHILNHILRSQWKGKEVHHSGDVLNRLELDVRTVITFITETLPSVLSTLTMFVGAFLYLATMDVWLAVITVGILPVFLLLSRFYISKMRGYTRDVRDSDSKVQSMLQETIQNRTLIKTLEQDDTMVDRLDSTQSVLRQQIKSRTRFSVASNFVLNMGFTLGYLIAFLWGALRMAEGTLSFGAMTAFLQLVFRIQHPARDIMKLAPAFVAVFTAAERLMEIEEEEKEQQGDAIMMHSPCGIRFKDVSYSYDETGKNVLSSLSFDFAPGTCTAILGETGVGKTTIIRLILSLIQPQQGKVEIYDDEDTHSISPRHRCNLIYVPQGNTLLSGTIRDNLLLGRLDATEEELRQALHTACADFVFQLPNGLDTICGESGGGLSEGQAQRIAIARSLLREGSIMLLDEATSALDIETEQQLLQNLLRQEPSFDKAQEPSSGRAQKPRTVIFITHRQAVVNYCSSVLRLSRESVPSAS